MRPAELRDSLAALATEHRGWLRRCARRYLAQPSAEDAVQDAMLIVLRDPSRFRWDDAKHARYAMARIVRFCALRLVKQDRQRQTPRAVDWQILDTYASANAEAEEYEWRDYMEANLRALAQEQPLQAEAVRLKAEGWSYGRMMRKLGLAYATVTWRVCQGRKRLRSMLEL